MKTHTDNRILWWTALLLAVLTFATYYRMLGNQFITMYDDGGYVLRNQHVQQGLTAENIRWAFASTDQYNWHPLTWISHMADCQFFKMDPAGHHTTSLLLHIASTLILFLALHRMTRSLWRSAFVAALFALHPLHVESVAWVAERKDVLSTFFWMLTMLAYAHYAERPSVSRYAWMFLAFALGLLSKPMLVTLPLVLLLLDYWPLHRLQRGIRHLVLEKVPLFMLTVGSSLATFYAQQHGGAVKGLTEFPIGVRAANAIVAYIGYIWKMLWPAKLSVIYPHPGTSLPVWYVLGSLVLLLGLTALALWVGRRHKYLIVGWLWYLGTLVPVIGLIQVGKQAMANRYTYVPLTGLFIIIAWGIPELLKKSGVRIQESEDSERPTSKIQRSTPKAKRRKEERERGGKGDSSPINHQPSTINHSLSAAAVLILVVLSVCTWLQVGHWHDSLALFDYAVKSTTDNPTAMGNLGWAYSEKEDWKAAGDCFRKALKLRPNLYDLHYGLGLSYRMTGQYDKAIAEYTRALELQPDSQVVRLELDRAMRGEGGSDDTSHPKYALSMQHYNLAVTAAQQGDTATAIREYKAAISARPDFAVAHCNLGVQLKDQGDIQGAIREYRAATKCKPSLPEAHNNLAVIFFMQGQYAEAWKEIHLAERYGFSPNPGFLDALSQKMPDPGS